MKLVLYHSTSGAAARNIERGGFRESKLGDVARGVFLSDRPLSGADGVSASCDVCFVLEVPDDFALSDFEIIEEGRPSDAYREWIVPASVVNSWPRQRWVDPDE